MFGKTLILHKLAGAMLLCAGTAVADDIELGKQLYLYGKKASGEAALAMVGTDIQASGEQFPCVNCHRPSGFGSSEGGQYVLPITGPILFSPRQLDRNRIYMKLFEEAQPAGFAAEVRKPRMRPAYTLDTLANALRSGVDPAGRSLDPHMPRYALDDDDVANLAAYLKTLSASPSPGVDASEIHFATVITTDVAERDKTAFVDTLNAFVGWMNRMTGGYQSRPGFSPYHMSELSSAFRQWRLHIWELNGPEETWPEQLANYYRNRPVFAVLSALVQGPWNSVAQFCDQEKVPCLFPNTELPSTSDAENGYTLYFSRGLELEGEALAHYFAGSSTQPTRLLMLRSTDAYGETPARAFAQRLKKRLPNCELTEVELSDAGEFDARLGELVASETPIDALVLWPGRQLPSVLAALNRLDSLPGIVTLPSLALSSQGSQAIDAKLADKLLFSYPYELPSIGNPRAFRVRKWMHAQGLEISDAALQYRTYYALTLAEFALDQILDDFYRDYFIEAIEHLAESNLNVGGFPSLALGPGQRFASNGAYIVKAEAPFSEQNLKAVSEWIVP